jgi:hypothetical protein
VPHHTQVLFNGITVGDVASWVDSLLVAYLLAFGATSFSRVETTACKERQLAYTFQVGASYCGINTQQQRTRGCAWSMLPRTSLTCC